MRLSFCTASALHSTKQSSDLTYSTTAFGTPSVILLDSSDKILNELFIFALVYISPTILLAMILDRPRTNAHISRNSRFHPLPYIPRANFHLIQILTESQELILHLCPDGRLFHIRSRDHGCLVLVGLMVRVGVGVVFHHWVIWGRGGRWNIWVYG